MTGTSTRRLTLAPLTLAHAALAAALHASSFDAPWDRAALARLLAMPGAFGFLGVVNGEPEGFILCRAAAGEGEILTLGVAPACRRSGLGGRLLEQALSASIQAGAQRLYLEVAENNHAARAFYGVNGFTAVGRRPGYYRRPGQEAVDALILCRTVVAP